MGQENTSSKFKQTQSVLGSEATVQRTKQTSEQATAANQTLRVLGDSLNPVPGSGTRYLGSLAVHAYHNETLDQVFFISQTDTMQGCSDILTSMAVQDLVGRAMESKGHKAPKKRSGW